MKYGVLVGRFQPLHIVHQLIIHEIMLDDRKPVIFVGSIDKQDEKNPLKKQDRINIINGVFPKGIHVYGITDKPESDSEWFQQIHEHLHFLGADPKDTPFYLVNKEGDYDWSKEIFKHGYWVKRPYMTDMINPRFDICSTYIRKNVELHKHCLHPYTYQYLKNFDLLP